MTVNRQWVVGRPHRGEGMSLAADNFEYREAAVPDIGDGQILVRASYFSPDPMVHAWVRGMPGRFDPIPVGQPLRGGVAGVVAASKNPGFKVGQGVTGFLDWTDYSVSDGTDYMAQPLQKTLPGSPMASNLATLGMTGVCAYLGMVDFGRVAPGDTVMVSGASGAIGSVAGQIARIAGARVIGIAGGAEKCAMVRELGFDDVIDYKLPSVAARYAETCPDGINLFFDNVGGALLDTALLHMAAGGRLIICGALAHYDQPTPITNHMMLAVRGGCTMQGFFYFNEMHRVPEAQRRLQGWLDSGQIREVLDIEDGFDAVPHATMSQFAGGVRGRKLVRVGPDTL